MSYTAVEGCWLWGGKINNKTNIFKNWLKCTFSRARVCASTPRSPVECVRYSRHVFALPVWVRLSVSLLQPQSVCQSVVFCLLDQEIALPRRVNPSKPWRWCTGTAVFWRLSWCGDAVLNVINRSEKRPNIAEISCFFMHSAAGGFCCHINALVWSRWSLK